jgi:hypothetical protein
MLSLLLLALIPTDIAALGSDDYDTRESATDRLRTLGPAAWPALLRALPCESEEARRRVNELLKPWWSHEQDLRAAQILHGGEYDLKTLFADWPLRMRIFRLAVKAGCSDTKGNHLGIGPGEACYLDPANDHWKWWTQYTEIEAFERSLESCRKKCGK